MRDETSKEFCDTIRECICNWNKIEAEVRRQMPLATKDEVYAIVKLAFERSLRIA